MKKNNQGNCANIIAQINEIAEAFLQTNDSLLELDALQELLTVLKQLKIELEAEEVAYCLHGFNHKQMCELYDAKMLLNSICFKIEKLIIMKS